MSTPTLLEVRGLRVAFAGREVVHGIDFTVRAGEKMALVGESGSGKTVSALSLLQLVPESSVTGSVQLNGREVLSLPEPALRAIRGDEVACIFQEPMTALNPLYTVGAQIAEVLTLKKGLTAKAAAERVCELLAATGLDDPPRRAKAYPHQLSGGQRQGGLARTRFPHHPKRLARRQGEIGRTHGLKAACSPPATPAGATRPARPNPRSRA